MQIISEEYLSEEKIEILKKEFDQAEPYRYVVMDNFIKPEVADQLFDNFPGFDKLDIHWKGMNENKSEGSQFELWHDSFKQLKNDVQSKEFSKWIAKWTGIEDSMVSNDKLGCGVHQGKNGSFLDPHVDFNMHHKLNKFRRLNLLIYLNKNWNPEEYGGALELWDAEMKNCVKEVDVVFNRCVIFETSDFSYHGYSKISLPEGITRKSFYTYIYTDEQGLQKSYHDTTFKSRPDEKVSKKVKTAAKETLKNSVKKTFKKLGIKFG